MTNPNLFKEYCLPYYQKYADLLHAQNKKSCSHVDGNLKPLVKLLPESGLDIYESFLAWRKSAPGENWDSKGFEWVCFKT